MAMWSKAWICSHSLALIAGQNLDRDVDVCFLTVLCVVRQ